MYKIFVVILTFNNEKTIQKLLDSCLPLKSKLEFIVVDNHSSDLTLKKIEKYKWVEIIKNKSNLGFSVGNNIGIKKALQQKADAVFLLNPDTVLKKDFVFNFSKTIKLFLDSNTLGIIGPKIADAKGMIWSMGGVLDKKRYSSILLKTKKENLDYISATAMLVKTDVFKKIGFLSDEYFLYYEDVDFCQKAIKAGFELEIDSSISVIHDESHSVGKNSKVMQYYLARNHMLFLFRFAPLSIKIREIIRLPRTIYQARDKRYELLGIIDYFLGRQGKNAYWN